MCEEELGFLYKRADGKPADAATLEKLRASFDALVAADEKIEVAADTYEVAKLRLEGQVIFPKVVLMSNPRPTSILSVRCPTYCR